MTVLGVMGVTTPAERLMMGGVGSCTYSRRRSVPVTTISTCRLPQWEETNRRANRARAFSAVALSHLDGIGLDLMAAILAPHN